MERSGTFDYILLETTGLADPGNLAPLFWMDEGLGSTIYLDGIVTLVDAKNILLSLSSPSASEISPPSQLSEKEEHGHEHKGPHLSIAHLQISHADVIVLNKADLVTEEELRDVEARVRSINALARVHVTRQSRVPALEGVLLDLHAYDDVDVEALEFASRGHSHLDPVGVSVPLFLLPHSSLWTPLFVLLSLFALPFLFFTISMSFPAPLSPDFSPLPIHHPPQHPPRQHRL